VTLHAEVLDLLPKLPKAERDVIIKQANQWMYGRESLDMDYGVRVEQKLFGTEARIANARRAFLDRIRSSARHTLKLPNDTKYVKQVRRNCLEA
jgi:cell division septum initiation protein DivIVA